MKKFYILFLTVLTIAIVLAITPNAFPALQGLGAVWTMLQRIAGIFGAEIARCQAWISNALAGDVRLSEFPLALGFVALNIACFATFAVDKIKAENGAWRIPNRTLLGMSLLGGAFGGLTAMIVCHHKTRQTAFRVGLPLMLIAHMALLLALYP